MSLARNDAAIKEITSITEIDSLVAADSWIVIDLDNTIIEPLTPLGSDQWFSQLINYASTLPLNHDDAIACVIAIYQEVQRHCHMKPVEPVTVDMIRAWHNQGRKVIGLTARDHVLEETTLRQLNEIDIYLHEIIFCEGQNKGVCWKNFLREKNLAPQDIVYVDDKERHIHHVLEASTDLQIKARGARYGYLDEKVKSFDLTATHPELAHLKPQLSNEAKAAIKKLNLLPDSRLVDEAEEEEKHHLSDSILTEDDNCIDPESKLTSTPFGLFNTRQAEETDLVEDPGQSICKKMLNLK